MASFLTIPSTTSKPTISEEKAATLDDFTENMSRLWKSGERSDLTIVVGDQHFKVHSWVLWPRSKFFDTALHGNFKASCQKPMFYNMISMLMLRIYQEAIEKRIELPDDKPHVVKRMLTFCYTMEYSHFPDGTVEPGYVGPSYTNAEIYILADKCEMQGLKQAAKTKFLSSMKNMIESESEITMPSLPALISLAYNSTPASDRTLKDCLVSYTQKYWKLLAKRESFKTVLAENPEFAFDIINSKPLVVKEKEKPYGASCWSCQSSDNWMVTKVTCSCGRYEHL